jgi:LPXTG-motif cell wall-anchored protein
MSKFVVALVIVGALLLGGLLSLFRNRRQPMGSPEVLERAKQRNRELEEKERREDET